MVTLPLGNGSIDVQLPDCEVDVVEPPGADVVDPVSAAEEALADPLGQPLHDRVDQDDEVAIVVTDRTRATPDRILLDAMFERLEAIGVPRTQVTIVVGLGLHRPMTDDELHDALGPYADITKNHDAERTTVVGRVDGVPIHVHEAVADADIVLSTGMVEPHQYAGFSGGAKTVVIGVGGEPLIRYTHGPEIVGNRDVRLGRIRNNPFRETIDRAGDHAGPGFCLNVTHSPDGLLGARAGEPRAVVQSLAELARSALSVPVRGAYDAVIAGVGAPKDSNLYQTTRAATYLILGAQNPLVPGGRVVIPADLPEGAGTGTGEQRFYARLSEATNATDLYQTMREGYEPGAQRAFVLARALREHDVYVTNTRAPGVVEECLLEARETVAEAVKPGSRVLVVPDALNTLII